MTLVIQVEDRRTQSILRTLPGTETQVLDRRTQLVFRSLGIAAVLVPDALPWLLTVRERRQVRTAQYWGPVGIQQENRRTPEAIVAVLRGATLRKQKRGTVIGPHGAFSQRTLHQARRDVAGWLGFSSVSEYRRVLALEGAAIFERRLKG